MHYFGYLSDSIWSWTQPDRRKEKSTLQNTNFTRGYTVDHTTRYLGMARHKQDTSYGFLPTQQPVTTSNKVRIYNPTLLFGVERTAASDTFEAMIPGWGQARGKPEQMRADPWTSTEKRKKGGIRFTYQSKKITKSRGCGPRSRRRIQTQFPG